MYSCRLSESRRPLWYYGCNLKISMMSPPTHTNHARAQPPRTRVSEESSRWPPQSRAVRSAGTGPPPCPPPGSSAVAPAGSVGPTCRRRRCRRRRHQLLLLPAAYAGAVAHSWLGFAPHAAAATACGHSCSLGQQEVPAAAGDAHLGWHRCHSHGCPVARLAWVWPYSQPREWLAAQRLVPPSPIGSPLWLPVPSVAAGACSCCRLPPLAVSSAG
eukprot:SAG22_NODE_1137_length_5394_cov_15.206232_3_plen_215_part_00